MQKQFYRLLFSFGLLSLSTTNALIAADFVVSTLVDSGDGSLRQALIDANPGDTINFESELTGIIVLESALPIINGNLSIQGYSSNQVAIDGQNEFQIFFVNSGIVDISNLTIMNGYSSGGDGGSSYSGNGGGSLGAGGGLFVNNTAQVTLTQVNVISNSAQGGNGGFSNSFYNDTGAGGGGGGGYNGGNGGQGAFSIVDGSGGGGGGGFSCFGGAASTGGGGGGGFSGVINGLAVNGAGGVASSNGGNGGDGFGGSDTGGAGGVGGTTPTNGENGVALVGGGGGGGGGSTILGADGGSGGGGSDIGGGGGGGGGQQGGLGGYAGDFGGGGGAGGSNSISSFANGGSGGFGGGGGGGGGTNVASTTGGAGGPGGFGGGGGGGGKNALGGIGGFLGGAGGQNDGVGGGGAALGGAVFVRQGGTLNIINGNYGNNAVIPGLGGGSGIRQGYPGSAVGEDIYLMQGSITTISTVNTMKLNVEGPGILKKTGNGELILSPSSASLTMDVNEGNGIEQIKHSSDLSSDPNVYVHEGTVRLLSVALDQADIHHDGTLSGTGLIDELTNSGLLHPGRKSEGSGYANLKIHKTYTQKNNGTLKIELHPDGTHNHLTVGGKANINGALQVILAEGHYVPGTKYTVLTSGVKVSGKFNAVNVQGQPHVKLLVVYQPNYVELQILKS